MAIVPTIHLHIPEIPGESEVEGVKIKYDELPMIDCKSWSWGATAKTNMHVSTGGNVSGASVQDIRITKTMDSSSPNLMNFCMTGKKMPEITLHCCKSGGDEGKQWDWYTIIMTNCIIGSVSCGASGEDVGQETITINFSMVQIKLAKEADEQGVVKAGSEPTFDIRKGKAV